MKATAVAHANIALVKYWGKRDETLVLPEAASLSVALDRLVTTTTVELGAAEELIQIGREARAAGILARRREVGRGLAVQLRQLAQVVVREPADVAALARRDQGFEPRPVGFALLHPMHGESR